MTGIDGHCDERFKGVRDAFTANFERGDEVGASVAVVHDGEMVVDLWGGFVDEARTRPWERDTITNVFSTTKTMTALCALVLVDRGAIDLDAPTAEYWPEFAAAGKEGVLVRHLMAHTAGLAGWEEPITVEVLYDWERATALLAAQAPWWEPGTAIGYHAWTQGYLVGEVVRRVSGRSLGTFFAEELAGPLGADFHIGTGPEHDHRIADVVPPPLVAGEPSELALRTLGNPPADPRWAWTEGWRRAEIPAGNGHGNARSVARVQSVVSHGGGLDGRRFLSPETLERIFDEQADGVDLVIGVRNRHGIGYGLASPQAPVGSNPRTCFWGGWGGSLVVNDLDSRMTVAYVMNRMGAGTLGDRRGLAVLDAAHEAVAG